MLLHLQSLRYIIRRLRCAPPRTKSKLQTPGGVNGRSSPATPTAVPTHKVIIHDRIQLLHNDPSLPFAASSTRRRRQQRETILISCR
ncbi:unnamed protein product [Linum trigynum]|uniref:Uncharacterized protein n=1 Tax=Linum trigynum TaxID=586398 RepID=A0AAV2DJE4_9ROSI